jgi:anaerobic magnesium-protoporphyrin IX monomethyl ester cyclase
MKILLINPRCETGKARWIPLGLGYIAAVLKESGFTVKVMDGDISGMQDFMPDVVGITATTPQINEAWRIAEQVKSYLPLAKVVLGGVHPTTRPIESITRPYVDIVVVGEGEITMNEICIALRNRLPIDDIYGIFFKSGEQSFTFTKPRELIDDLDSLPYPARELFNFPQDYTPGYYRKLPCATILTSRGCPGQCTFCNKATFGSKFRMRSAKSVVLEICYLVSRYGIREFHISDDNFTTDKNRAMEICDKIIDLRLDITWACSNGIRVDFVTQELLDKMKQAGCYRVAFGIESGSPKILKSIHKNITLEKIDNAVRMAKKAKLITVGFFMVGNYGETDQTINETIRFIKKIGLDYTQFTIATPYPGTELAEQVLDRGTIFAEKWSDYNTYTGSVFEWDNLSKKKIDAYQQQMYRKCYLNIPYVFKRLVNMKKEDLHFIVDGMKILKGVIGLKEPNR